LEANEVNKQKRINRHGKYRRVSRRKNGTISRDISEGEYQKRERAAEKRKTTIAKKQLVKTAVEQLPVIGKISTARGILQKMLKCLLKRGKNEVQKMMGASYAKSQF
jgi:hypothetical protein